MSTQDSDDKVNIDAPRITPAEGKVLFLFHLEQLVSFYETLSEQEIDEVREVLINASHWTCGRERLAFFEALNDHYIQLEVENKRFEGDGDE
jgi:hypothetical protein